MLYQSFIRFLDHCQVNYQDVENMSLPRLKKQIVAEFAMEPSGIITLEGYSYNKHDMLQELERTDLLQRINYHLLIWQHSDLLTLLERGVTNVQLAEKQWFPLVSDAGFVAFVSPFLAPRFDMVMKHYLQGPNMQGAASWLDFLVFVAPYDEEHALKSVRSFLEAAIRLFRNLNDKTFKQRGAELAMWHQQNWSAFINALPESLQHYTDELADSIINFTVRIQKAGKKICYLISKQLSLLVTVNYPTAQLIANNHRVYKKNYDKTTLKGLASRIPPVYLAVVLVLALLRGLSSSGCGEDRNKPVVDRRVINENEVDQFNRFRGTFLDAFKSVPFTEGAELPTDSLKQKSFSGDYLYLLVAQRNNLDTKLFPFVVKNNTNKNLPLFLVKSGEVFWFELRANAVISLEPSAFNQDLIIDFRSNDGNLAASEISLKTLNYIYLSNIKDSTVRDIHFADDSPVNLPYLDDDKIMQQPLVITITGTTGSHYFEIKGRAAVAGYKDK